MAELEPLEPRERTEVNVAQFIEEWKNTLDSNEFTKTNQQTHDEYIMEKLDKDASMLSELESVCGIEALDCKGEVGSWMVKQKRDFLDEVPNGILLLTTDFQKAELQRRKSESGRIRQLTVDLKGRIRDGQVQHMLSQIEEKYELNIDAPDAVLTVLVMFPIVSGSSRTRTMQEFHILGQQKLTDLRDAITCAADNVPIGDFSDNPNIPQHTFSRDLYKSGFFFIANTFYNDARDDNSRDYSQTIINWAMEKKRGLGPYKKSSMQDTLVRDLSIQLNAQYLYMHQGNCEHLVFFTDIRMLHREDCLDLSYYPLQLNRERRKHILCKACVSNLATWVVRDSPLSPEDPCFFCETCFKLLHYDQHGHKLGEFSAYPYANAAY